mgnify:CR=1 FL=1|jgi:hypothetical protein
MSAAKKLYRVSFRHGEQVYEIYARQVSHGGLLGFVEVEKLVFGERSTLVLDPGEEKLKSEFANVERTYIPVHAVLRIDEVSKEGKPRVLPGGGESGRVMTFPTFIPKS